MGTSVFKTSARPTYNNHCTSSAGYQGTSLIAMLLYDGPLSKHESPEDWIHIAVTPGCSQEEASKQEFTRLFKCQAAN